MAEPDLRGRAWFVILSPDDARLRCSYVRHGKLVDKFTVQLELLLADKWQPIVRYDNAHGFCHRDVIHADGTQDKIPVFAGDVNATFTHAIEDLRMTWESHKTRYLSEVSET